MENAARSALQGLRVVDFSQIGAGPTCSMIMGDMGADVIKVEPPTGDLGRHLGPPWNSEGESSIFVAFNRNKRSIGLDLKRPAMLEVARRLCAGADVVLESFRPGVMAQLGLGANELMASNHRLIYCSVSAYGSTGPKARHGGVDGIVQSVSGLMSLIGEEGEPPSKVQAPVVDVATGYMATIAILAQLHLRERTGHGGFLDVSMFATAVALQQSSLTAYLFDGELPVRAGSGAPYSAPNEAFRTSDGWIMVAAYSGGRWERLCALLGCDELAADPRFATSSDRVRNRQAMRDCLNAIFARHGSDHWLARLEAEDILCSRVSTYDDLTRDPQFDHMDLIAETVRSDGAILRMPGQPINSVASQTEAHRAPPQRDEHGAEILAELGYLPGEIEGLHL
ncbi:CaiB/BaiF CoA-transferase family protein [Sphingobium sp. SA916]|uniref:CaiB/BaiF CoA transferase family protein n=1 Tax=Sphingobium sp. SA916 TaxID=1851207 RepID=UPI000C9ECEBE|nr:CoA transferase [Sphingobium sp. SA916]PNP96729.1 carnitine dehydratase [Sphingobium sp. SA916]